MYEVFCPIIEKVNNKKDIQTISVMVSEPLSKNSQIS